MKYALIGMAFGYNNIFIVSTSAFAGIQVRKKNWAISNKPKHGD